MFYVYPRLQPDLWIAKKDNLVLETPEFAATKPKMNTHPFVHSRMPAQPHALLAMENPLDDILAFSRKQLLAHELQLPLGKEDPQQEAASEVQSGHTGVLKTALKGALINDRPGSPKMHIPSFLPDPELQNQSPENLAQNNQKQLANMSLSDKNDTNSDPLACHANKIMRMAMDTTMIESFCNSSISLNFLNLDESIHKLAEGGKQSRPQNKRGTLLDYQRAARVEISAADLEDAISNPIR